MNKNNASQKEKNVFKECTLCHTLWARRDYFLSDPALTLVGYQVHFDDLKLGLFCFTHTKNYCETTMALPVENFEDLYKGPLFRERLTGSKECPGYCLHKDELRPCPARCECASVRALLQIIKNWPKSKN